MIVYVKEVSPRGEDYMKIGKLTMVELAGNECGTSRGLETKENLEVMNKSILTFNRLIGSIIDRTELPFGESVLTKLLAESFNGKGFSSFIGAVCGSQATLDDVTNTLDFLYRAKSLRNRPEQNKKFLKGTILEDYRKRLKKLEDKFKKIGGEKIYMPDQFLPNLKKRLDERTKRLTAAEDELSKAKKKIDSIQKTVVAADKELDDNIEHLSIHQENEDINVEKSKTIITAIYESIKDVKGYQKKTRILYYIL